MQCPICKTTDIFGKEVNQTRLGEFGDMGMLTKAELFCPVCKLSFKFETYDIKTGELLWDMRLKGKL